MDREEAEAADESMIAALTLVAAAVLTSFYVNYFREFATTGGRSHLAYITAATEPKQQALEQILARATGPNRVTIVTQQWWLRWPIAYLAIERPNVSVSMGFAMEPDPTFQEALGTGRLFFVEFAGTPELATAIALDPRARIACRQHNGARRERSRSSRGTAGHSATLDLHSCRRLIDLHDPEPA